LPRWVDEGSAIGRADDMKFSHVFISRPRREAEELAAMLAPLGLQTVVQPAFDYVALDAYKADPETCAELESSAAGDVVVFTSPRAVTHGLSQLPRETLLRLKIAAIGPATTSALAAAGIPVAIASAEGFTSEDLLASLADQSASGSGRPGKAFVLAAPGGRQALVEGLRKQGWQARTLMVYQSEPVALDQDALAMLEDVAGLLAVWTSGNAMNALSQRLPPAAWFRICQGEWLVISERLRRLARAYGPPRIHLASGPDNGAILAAIRSLL
jgi:uroporphyrinogen-III synthase